MSQTLYLFQVVLRKVLRKITMKESLYAFLDDDNNLVFHFLSTIRRIFHRAGTGCVTQPVNLIGKTGLWSLYA